MRIRGIFIPNYNATGNQKARIAQLCMALKISEPLEEQQMTSGDAWSLITQLSAEVKARREE